MAILLKGVPSTSDMELSMKESYRNSSIKHNVKTLWAMFTISILLTLAGIVLLSIEEITWFVGLICILFFGACSCSIGFMIKVKKRNGGE
jgi:hypothetical protein